MPDDTAPSNAELAGRVDRLDSKLDTIIGMFRTGSPAQAAAQQHTEDRLDRPSSVADEIARQLEEQRARDAASRDADDQAEWRKSVDDRLTGMTEQAPADPPRRATRFMWGTP
jgi:hypothetical protein